ncbi:helicase C-terminal domain-containing protein [Bordetella flabilis]|uniref:helicase C-terminal domain-containing protein n=2 Tax=Bordetella flabilis TaxID=463014 RepID=UPI000B14C486
MSMPAAGGDEPIASERAAGPSAQEIDAAPPAYTVAVRALCEFSARTGDLDLRFAPSPSAQQGQAGHAVVTARRPAGYQTEVFLSGTHGRLRVRGRADGYDPAGHRVEEIKTHRGNAQAIPHHQRALHWAQVRIYGHLLCRKLGCAEIGLALVYFDIATQRETVLVERQDAASLQAFFEDACARFSAWADLELAHRDARDAALSALRFPHASFRAGQRELAETVYRAVRDRQCAMVQAPTGIGKTLATLFPTLKAAPGRLDKVFFLCAKTAGRQLALQAIDRMQAEQGAGPSLRTLELVARDQACVHPDKACHGGSCPLARNFYDRLPAARAAALAEPRWDRAAVRGVALEHAVCPYFLAQELARWSDVVIGDYHYYFDHNGLLHGLALANQWRVAVLVDEAHNVLERGRGMYTAELSASEAQRLARVAAPALRAPLRAMAQALRPAGAQTPQAPSPALRQALEQGTAAIAEHMAGAVAGGVAEQVPGNTAGNMAGHGSAPAGADDALLRFYFDALRFLRIADDYGAHSIFDVTQDAACIRNVVPAPFLAPRFAAAHASVLFSATLNPWHFYTDTLGVPRGTVCLDIPPPFDPARLAVHVVGNVSTRYADRDGSLDIVVDLIAREYARRPGNYLCFASSFEYLHRIFERLRERHPAMRAWTQTAGMPDQDRAAFLARFQADGQGLGFAILGGAFGEGIDLPGTRLIGAFVLTLGLPQWNRENGQMMRCMQDRFGQGYDYAYLYPGLQKVVQAAGRVIRSETDEGCVYLVDERFRRPAVRRLLPAWWQITEVPA